MNLQLIKFKSSLKVKLLKFLLKIELINFKTFIKFNKNEYLSSLK